MHTQRPFVLSIDLDYAFSPVIALYDDFIEGSRVSLAEQQAILERHNAPKPQLNPAKIQYLQQVFAQAQKEAPTIVEACHHHEIVPHLRGDELQMINIDHHHDIFYPGWHESGVLDEGNWVYWLAQQKRLKSYLWIRNDDSEDVDPTVPIDFPYREQAWIDPERLPPIELIFLCTSPHWTGMHTLDLLMETTRHELF